MKKILNILDYIFYRSYKFFSSHRMFAGMEVIDAISMIFFTIFIPVAAIIGTLARHNGIMIGNYGTPRYIGMLLFFLVGYLPLMKRYMYNKSIKKNNYRVFKQKWDNEDPKVYKKRGIFIVLMFVNNILLFPILIIKLL